MKLAEKLKELRTRSGLTQEALAAASGMSVSGRCRPTPSPTVRSSGSRNPRLGQAAGDRGSDDYPHSLPPFEHRKVNSHDL